MVSVGHHDHLPAPHRPGRIPCRAERAARWPVHPLHRPRLRPSEPVQVDLLEDRLGRHVVDVVLVRRPARPVAGRRQDLDDEQPVGGELGRDHVIDLTRRPARPADLHAHVTRQDRDRHIIDGDGTDAWRLGDRDSDSAAVNGGSRLDPGGPVDRRFDDVVMNSPDRQVDGRRQIVEQRESPRELDLGVAMGRTDDGATAIENHDARLVIGSAEGEPLTCLEHRRPERQVPPPSLCRVDEHRPLRTGPQSKPIGWQVVRWGARVDRRIGHPAGRMSGFGTMASVTWWSSSWYDPTKARRVRALGPNVSNSSGVSPSGS